jgi:hypothetical protein
VSLADPHPQRSPWRCVSRGSTPRAGRRALPALVSRPSDGPGWASACRSVPAAGRLCG